MSAKLALIALVTVVAVAFVGVVVAVRSDPDEVRDEILVGRGDSPTAESLPVEAEAAPAVRAKAWLNTDGLAPADLEGKVVLYEFWTFGCSNCQAVLPYVKAWHARYADDGLVVLSIHTPEFDYEADPEAVAAFVAEEEISYPVALDPDKATWRAFENRYWPAFYLHDQQGRRRLTHFGEGDYDRTEDAIRALLGVDEAEPRATVAP